MFRKTSILLPILIITGIVVTAFLLIFAPASNADDSLTTPEAQEIMIAIQRAKDAIAIAQHTGDFSKLEETLIDHPDYLNELQPEQQGELRQFVGRISGVRAAETFGYLTAMRNKITYKLQGEEFVRAAMEKAKAENHEFTSEDMQVLASQNPDKYITWPQTSTVFAASNPVERKYKSIKIDGDKARIVYDEGVKDRTAIFVRIEGKWYVAGIF